MERKINVYDVSKNLHIKSFFYALGLSLLISSSLNARSSGFCEAFDKNDSAWGPCSNGPNITHSVVTSGGSDGGGYLEIHDGSGPSLLCTGQGAVNGSAQSPYIGDWTQLSGSCKQFCFDVKLIFGGHLLGDNATFTPYIGIRSGSDRFIFRANITITPDAGNNGGWHRICLPISTINPSDNLPSDSNGSWQWYDGSNWVNTHHPQWNSAITNVETVELPVDFSGSPSEIIGYDNICIGNCDDDFPPDPITCCPPWDKPRLQSMWSEINVGQVNDPFIVKLTPTSQINQQMQAFADYAVTLNPNVQSMNLGFILEDCQDNSDQSTQSTACNPVWHGSPKLMSWGAGQGGVPTIYNLSGGGWTSGWPSSQVLDTATQASVPNNWYRLIAVPVIRYVDESFELLENCDLVVATFNRKQIFQKNRRVITSPMETIRKITTIDQSKVSRMTGGNTIQKSINKMFKLKKKDPIKLAPRKIQKFQKR